MATKQQSKSRLSILLPQERINLTEVNKKEELIPFAGRQNV